MKTQNQANKKISGVLLHPTSLPGSKTCGSFGEPARKWLKALSENGIGLWQFLPLSPTDSTGSPYSSPSGFALNPWLLDAEDLVADDFLDDSFLSNSDCSEQVLENKNFVDFRQANRRIEVLKALLLEKWKHQKQKRYDEFEFWSSQQYWIHDHAIFMELRDQNHGLPWWEWPDGFNIYDKKKLKTWLSDNEQKVLGHQLLQWHLDRQWKALRSLAKELGIKLFGDLPFYVSLDSCDVWRNRSFFSILENGKLLLKSGVPPDYFSSTGQLWGSPIYRWSRHRSDRFRWWRKRIARHLELVDLLRIDHFRALDAFWAIPGADETAQYGYWLPSPGLEILNMIKKECQGNLPLVAEDLGLITSEVEYLREYFKLPGMKILQFAFDGNNDNPYLPENINGNNWIVYTGTHDNSTTLGWWESLTNEIKNKVSKYFEDDSSPPNWNMIRLGMKTDAKIFIAPIQDLLSLDDNARFNKPGTINGNWSWRLPDDQFSLKHGLKLYGELATSFDRSSKII